MTAINPSSLAALGRTALSEPEAKALLADFGVRSPSGGVAYDAPGLKALAAKLTGPFALKIVSRSGAHKSERGGVRLGVTADGLDAAFRAMPQAPDDRKQPQFKSNRRLKPTPVGRNCNSWTVERPRRSSYTPAYPTGRSIADETVAVPAKTEATAAASAASRSIDMPDSTVRASETNDASPASDAITISGSEPASSAPMKRR